MKDENIVLKTKSKTDLSHYSGEQYGLPGSTHDESALIQVKTNSCKHADRTDVGVMR